MVGAPIGSTAQRFQQTNQGWVDKTTGQIVHEDYVKANMATYYIEQGQTIPSQYQIDDAYRQQILQAEKEQQAQVASQYDTQIANAEATLSQLKQAYAGGDKSLAQNIENVSAQIMALKDAKVGISGTYKPSAVTPTGTYSPQEIAKQERDYQKYQTDVNKFVSELPSNYKPVYVNGVLTGVEDIVAMKSVPIEKFEQYQQQLITQPTGKPIMEVPTISSTLVGMGIAPKEAILRAEGYYSPTPQQEKQKYTFRESLPTISFQPSGFFGGIPIQYTPGKTNIIGYLGQESTRGLGMLFPSLERPAPNWLQTAAKYIPSPEQLPFLFGFLGEPTTFGTTGGIALEQSLLKKPKVSFRGFKQEAIEKGVFIDEYGILTRVEKQKVTPVVAGKVQKTISIDYIAPIVKEIGKKRIETGLIISKEAIGKPSLRFDLIPQIQTKARVDIGVIKVASKGEEGIARLGIVSTTQQIRKSLIGSGEVGRVLSKSAMKEDLYATTKQINKFEEQVPKVEFEYYGTKTEIPKVKQGIRIGSPFDLSLAQKARIKYKPSIFGKGFSKYPLEINEPLTLKTPYGVASIEKIRLISRYERGVGREAGAFKVKQPKGLITTAQEEAAQLGKTLPELKISKSKTIMEDFSYLKVGQTQELITKQAVLGKSLSILPRMVGGIGTKVSLPSPRYAPSSEFEILRTPTIERNKLVVFTGIIPIEKIKPSERQIQKPIEINLQKPIERTLQKPLERTIQSPMEKMLQKPIERTMQTQLQKQLQKQMQIPIQRQVTTIIRPPRIITPKPPIIISSVGKSTKKIIGGKKEAFIAQVRRKGKWFDISPKVTKETATAYGERAVKSTLAASFRTRKVSGEPSSIRLTPQVRKDEFYTKGDITIQRAPKRLSARSEVSEIISTRKSKKRGRGLLI